MTFTAGHVDDSGDHDTVLNVYLDGVIAYTAELKYDDVARPITIPLKNALQMKIEIFSEDLNVNVSPSVSYGFSQGEFK